MARPPKCRCICSLPKYTGFTPEGISPDETIRIGLDEFEVLRLIDYVGFSQEKCAGRMGVSRPTVARLYEHARHSVAEAMVLGKRLVIEGGDVCVCLAMKPECANEPFCCHRQNNTNIGEDVEP